MRGNRQQAPPPGRQGAWRWAPALGYVGAGLIALALGFRAISDDDYARAQIAQRFALDPRLDPTGSSWLPFPFWALGAAMRAFGPTLETARALALAWAAASGLLLWAAGRVAGLPPRAAALGALAPLGAPSLAPLAAAHVPELPTAALATYGVMAACFGEGLAPIAGGAALFAAALSRYEAWPLALYAACVLAARAVRNARPGPPAPPAPDRPGGAPAPAGLAGGRPGSATVRAGLARGRPGAPAAYALAAAIALAGPCAWLAWNHLAHADALSFARRVAAYHASVQRAAPTLGRALAGYPWALVREAPGLFCAVLALLACRRGAIWRWGLPLGAGLTLLVSLCLAEARGGAPTHHPERALVAIWCLFGVTLAGEGARLWGSWRVGGGVSRAGGGAARAGGGAARAGGGGARAGDGRSRGGRARAGGGAPLGRRALAAGASLGVIAAAGFAWRLRSLPGDFGPSRADELALGRALAGRVGPGERVLIAPSSYGFLAASVAFGRPDDLRAFVPRAVDPRSTSEDPFARAPALARGRASAGARWALATGPQRTVAEALGLRGAPLVGAWWLYDAGGGP